MVATFSSFDLPSLLERVGDDADLAVELINLFLRDLPKLSTALDSALQQGDAGEVGRQAHTLKGAAANLSAEPVVDLARAMEASARSGDVATAQLRWGSLQAALQTLRQDMQAYTQH